MKRTLYTEDHESFREVAREFVAREVVPHQQRWEQDHLIDRSLWAAAGKQGLLGMAAPEAYGGGGQPDFRYRAGLMEELAAVGAASVASGFAVQDDIVLPYLLDLGNRGAEAAAGCQVASRRAADHRDRDDGARRRK